MYKTHRRFRLSTLFFLVLLALALLMPGAQAEDLVIIVDKTEARVGDALTATWVNPYPQYTQKIKFVTLDEFGNELVSNELNYNSTLNGVTHRAVQAGTGFFRVYYERWDSLKQEDILMHGPYQSETITIAPAAQPPAAGELSGKLVLSKTNVAIGETITATVEPSGGTPPYTLSLLDWDYDGDAYGPIELQGMSASITPHGGSGNILFATIWDSANNRTTLLSDYITITGTPLEAKLTLSQSNVMAGQEITASWEFQGGTKPYKILEGSCIEDGAVIKVIKDGTSSISFTPTSGNIGFVTIIATDASGIERRFIAEFGIMYDSDLGVTVSLDKTIVQPGDSLTATWEITGGKAPYTVKGNWGYEPLEAVSGTSASTTVVNNRWYFYNLEVTDATGYTVNARTNPDPVFIDQSRINIAFSPDQPKFGDTITATVSIPGVDVTDAVYNYTWALDGIEQHRVTRSPAASDSYQPDKSGTLSLRVYVSLKSNGFEGQNAVVVLSPAEPLVVNGDYDKTTVAINTPITANWTIAGGAAPYTVEPIWFVSRDNEYYDWVGGLPGDNSSSLTPKDGLRGYLELRVKDTQGQEKRITFPPFRIIGAEQITPMQVDIKLDKSSVASGDIITANWTITGGAPPYVVEEAYWEVSDGWEYVIITEDEREGTASLRVPQGTRGLFHLTIRDYLGGWYYRSNVFRVLAPFPGDANLDGRLDIQDVASIANYLVGGARPASPANADADGQNGITLADLIWLINKLTGA